MMVNFDVQRMTVIEAKMVSAQIECLLRQSMQIVPDVAEYERSSSKTILAAPIRTIGYDVNQTRAAS